MRRRRERELYDRRQGFLKAPAVVVSFDDVTVMGQPVKQRGRHFVIDEHVRPYAEGEIGGEDDGGALVDPAED